MPDEEKVAAIGKIGEEATKTVKRIPNQDHFESLMSQRATKPEIASVEEAQTKPSPIEELQSTGARIDRTQVVTPNDVIAQARKTIGTIDGIKQDLQTPHLDIKGSVDHLLTNKLVHIDENLQVALSKIGSEVKPQEPLGISKPIEKFLSFLTHSQHQLDTLATDVQNMQEHGSNFSAAAMLAVQTKVGYVQQELEFFTSLLNKALESTKTIMNVQV